MNSKRFYIICMLLTMWSCCLTASAQTEAQETAEEDTVINIVAYYCKNDTMVYTSRDIEYKVEKGDTTVQHDVETEFMLVVRDSTSTGYTMEMTETNMHINEVESDVLKAMIESAWDISKGIKCVFTTDEMGVVKNIVNWREIRDKTKEMMAVVYDTLYAKYEGLDTLMSRNRLEQQMMIKMKNEESLRQEIYDELQLLFGCHGRAWNITDSKWEDENNGYPCEMELQVGYTTQEEDTDTEGDYAIWSKATTRIPVEDALEVGLGYYGNFMTDNLNDEIQKNKQAILDGVKAETKESTVEIIEGYNYFSNGWPKDCSKLKDVSVGNNYQVVKIQSIVWDSHSWYNY